MAGNVTRGVNQGDCRDCIWDWPLLLVRGEVRGVKKLTLSPTYVFAQELVTMWPLIKRGNAQGL